MYQLVGPRLTIGHMLSISPCYVTIVLFHVVSISNTTRFLVFLLHVAYFCQIVGSPRQLLEFPGTHFLVFPRVGASSSVQVGLGRCSCHVFLQVP